MDDDREDNVVKFERRNSRGIQVEVSATYRSNPTAPLMFYRARHWIAKDAIADVLETNSDSDTSTIIRLKGNISFDCFTKWDQIVKRMEEHD